MRHNTVQKDLYVSIEYSFQDPDGNVLGSSEYTGPMEIHHGNKDTIPGLDNAIAGHAIGDELKFELSPEMAYGLRDPALVRRLPRAALKEVDSLQVGMRLNINKQPMLVTAVDDESVELDANHPLAGLPLLFHVTIIAINEHRTETHNCACSSCTCRN